MAYQTFQQEYMQIPPVTRAYTTACVLTTIAVQLDVITPLQIYFNPDLIYRRMQLWRLITNFVFFGTFGFNFLFNMIFLYRHCRMLEEGSFRGKTADFVFMFILGATVMTGVAEQKYIATEKKASPTLMVTGQEALLVMYKPHQKILFIPEIMYEYVLVVFLIISIMGVFVNLVFLGQAFTIMLVYVWSRRNPYVRMSFFGILTFQAPFLPWVLVGFSLLLGNPIIVDVIGIACGHIYYFLEDVFPLQERGFRILHTPGILKRLFDPPADAAAYEPLPEQDRPGGFAWGNVGFEEENQQQ